MKAKEMIRVEAERNALAHAYLFLGRDRSKIDELIALLVQSKGCLPSDVSTLEPPEKDGKQGEIGIEEVRTLLHDINLSPNGKCRIAIIYNAERLNQSSGNILLKSLEEPPGEASFILVAEGDSLLPTIKSRCRIIKVAGDEEPLKANDGEYTKLLNDNFYQFSSAVDKIIKDGKVAELLDVFEDHFRFLMNKSKKVEYVGALERVILTRKEIDKNVSARLALEAMILELKEIGKKVKEDSCWK